VDRLGGDGAGQVATSARIVGVCSTTPHMGCVPVRSSVSPTLHACVTTEASAAAK
jgi:hypothetical protein